MVSHRAGIATDRPCKGLRRPFRVWRGSGSIPRRAARGLPRRDALERSARTHAAYRARTERRRRARRGRLHRKPAPRRAASAAATCCGRGLYAQGAECRQLRAAAGCGHSGWTLRRPGAVGPEHISGHAPLCGRLRRQHVELPQLPSRPRPRCRIGADVGRVCALSGIPQEGQPGEHDCSCASRAASATARTARRRRPTTRFSLRW